MTAALVLHHLSQRTATESWDLVQARPPADLAELVLRLTGYEERLPSPTLRRELPRPMAVLVVSFGAPFELGFEHPQEGYAVTCGSFLAGLHDATATNRSTGLSHCLQVDFTPLGARLLFGLPMQALGNRIVALDALLGAEAGRLEQRLFQLPDWPARFALVLDLLRRRLAERGGPSPDIRWAWRALQASHGALPVGALTGKLAVSRRHLVRRFREELGLPPKTLARMLRFNRALDAMTRGDCLDLADLALDAGYYDQAHFNREFRAFAGMTPGAWLAAADPYRAAR
jgi:AraC-like DNA-binding protein